MKSIKKVFRLTLIIISAVATLLLCTACGEGDGAPEGMQLAKGSDELGYYFYVPEEWLLSPYSEIAASYASTVDTSSASYTEATPPAISDDATVPLSQRRAVAASEYFKKSLDSYAVAPSIIVNGEAVTFGNADIAFKYVFDHEYQSSKFRTMQILVYFEDRFGIFTFNSLNTPLSSDKPQFEYYSEKTQQMLDNFKFVSKSTDGTTDNEGEKIYDADGFILRSDKSLAGFELYLPEDFKVTHSSGLIAASLPDSSSFTATKSNITGVTYDGYFNQRKGELEALFGTVTVIIDNSAPWKCVKCDSQNDASIDKCNKCDTARSIGVHCKVGNANQAFLYEYTYFLSGVEYRVYQVLAATRTTGYAFTYTARVDNFDNNIDQIKAVLGKVNF